jgi:hypothetical protein
VLKSCGMVDGSIFYITNTFGNGFHAYLV